MDKIFAVKLLDAGENKTGLIKAIVLQTALSEEQAFEALETLPAAIMYTTDSNEAETVKKIFEKIGGAVLEIIEVVTTDVSNEELSLKKRNAIFDFVKDRNDNKKQVVYAIRLISVENKIVLLKKLKEMFSHYSLK